MFPQRYNRTNFVTSAVAAKILTAMRGALSDGLQHYVDNKHGQRWLRVCIKPVDGSQGRYTYEFLAGNGQDVGHLVFQALFVWATEYETEFGQLIAELYRLTEHPYSAAKRKKREAEAAELEKARFELFAKLGVTHSFRTPSGRTVLGRYVRNWLGRKGFLAIADHTGRAFGKPYKLDNEAYLYGTTQGLAA